MPAHRKYNWDSWLSKPSIRLVKGRHYDIPSYSMAQQVRNAAAVRNIKVSVQIFNGAILVETRGVV